MISPELLIESPVGRPVADQLVMAFESASVADSCRLTAVPVVPDCAPGEVTLTGEMIVQVKLTLWRTWWGGRAAVPLHGDRGVEGA